MKGRHSLLNYLFQLSVVLKCLKKLGENSNPIPWLLPTLDTVLRCLHLFACANLPRVVFPYNQRTFSRPSLVCYLICKPSVISKPPGFSLDPPSPLPSLTTVAPAPVYLLYLTRL